MVENPITTPGLSSLNLEAMKTLFDNSPLCVIIAEIPSGRIFYINEAVRRFRGPTTVKLTDIELHEYIHSWKDYFPDGRLMTPEEMPLGRAVCQKIIVDNEEVMVELDDGSMRWALASAFPIMDGEGECIAAAVVWQDITRQKEENAAHADGVEQELLTMCSSCKDVKDNQGRWQRLEKYFKEEHKQCCSHGLCPDCIRKLYPELVDELKIKDL